MTAKIDKYMITFCDDCLQALQEYNQSIMKNISKTKYKRYYAEFPKGLYIRSITEPIIKFIIFTKLCRNHKMLSEASGLYDGKKLLDLAIQSPYIEEKDSFPQQFDIAIEFKWGH